MKRSIKTLFALSAILFFAGCSSLQVTEEAIGNQNVAGVSISSKTTATQAVLANAVVYFEYSSFEGCQQFDGGKLKNYSLNRGTC